MGKRTLMELTLKVAILTTRYPPLADGKGPQRRALSTRDEDLSTDREGIAAAAGRGGVRIAHLEGGAHHVLDEVDLGAPDELQRYRIDDELDAVALEDDVVVEARLVEGEAVLKAGAAAARDGEPQKGLGQVLLLLELRHPPGGALAQGHSRLRCAAAAFRHALAPRHGPEGRVTIAFYVGNPLDLSNRRASPALQYQGAGARLAAHEDAGAACPLCLSSGAKPRPAPS